MEKIKLEKYCANKIENVPAKGDYDIDYIDISSVDNVLKKVIGYSTYNIAEAPSRAKQILKKNDVLVSTVRPNLNAVAICDFETENILVGSTGFCVLRGNDKVNNKFLFYFCQSNHFVGELMKVATGASYPAVSKNDVKNVLIPKYQIEKQNEIVETLDKVNGLISLRKEQLRLLDDLIKSRFVEMFGDPISNPMGWVVKELNDVCDVRDGTHDSPSYVLEGYPLVTSKNIVNGKLDLSNVNYITQEDYENINKRSKVDLGDIIMPMIGTIGNPLIILDDPRFAIKNVALMKFNKSSISNIYIHSILCSRIMEQIKSEKSRGGTQKFLSLGDIRKLKIPVPHEQLQNQYAVFVYQVDKLKVKVQKSLDETQILFDSLMHEYFE